jgi:methylated-DNA-protein-cysteine methyltransferase-like protein
VGEGFHAQVWELVQLVPAGSVTTYGDVAAALGLASVARQVGWALAALPADQEDVPWQRVVNAQGQISHRGAGAPSSRQAKRLATEGVQVTEKGRVVDFASKRHDFDAHGN